mgnify:CR=1 FL=1
MTKFKCNLTLEDATDIQFTNLAGANTGKIESDGNNLVLSNAVGDILLGDGASDVYIGDGTNSVDILFEVSGSISAESGAELTLGGGGGTLALGGAISLADYVSAISATGVNTVDVGTSAKPFKNIYAAHHVGGSSINYATSRGWVEDDAPLSSTQVGEFGGNFVRNGAAAENAIVWGLDPFGNKALLWKAIMNTSDDNDDGGWNKEIVIPADNDIGYLSYVYFKVDFTPNSSTQGSKDGTVYLGAGQVAGETIAVSNDANNTNPYFVSDSLFNVNNNGPVVANRWYLMVGVLQAYNNSTTDTDTLAGVYDVETGEKVKSGAEFKMGNNTTGQKHRAYIYYDQSTDDENAYFWNPGFHAIDGSEPKIQDLVKRQVYLDDNVKAAFGTGNDLEIYHDGSNSYIDDTGTGSLYIRGGGDVNIRKYTGEQMIKAIQDGAVELYHNNVKKFETKSDGVEITGNITVSGTVDGIDIATRDAILTSTTTTAGAALPKAGGAMTGAITTNSTFDGVDIATRDAVLTSTTTTANAALPKAGGTMSGAIAMGSQNITGAGTITGTTLTGTSLDINGAADISGNLTGVDTLTATTLSVTNYGLASGDIPNNAANTTGNADTATLAADATTLATPRAIFGQNFDGSAAVTGSATLGGIVMDGNTITGINDSSKFTNNDNHIMTSAAIEDKILGYGYTAFSGEPDAEEGTKGVVEIADLTEAIAGEESVVKVVTPFLVAKSIESRKVHELAAPTSAFGMNSQKITGLATPTANADAANKTYVDAKTWNWNDITAGTVPTFNQNTTGTAARLTTAVNIGGVSFTGAADINLPGVNADGTRNTTGQAGTVASIAGLAPNTATTQATQPNITTLAGLTSFGAAGATTNIVAGDLTMYNPVNNGNPKFSIGAAGAESVYIKANYDSGAQTLNYADIGTNTADSGTHAGYLRFVVDGTAICGIFDDGIQLMDGAGLTIGNSTTGSFDVITDNGSGTTTLSNIDALDATTEATIEAAIDTLANLTTVGTIGTGEWNGTPITTAYITNDAITEDKLANTLLAEIDANTTKNTAPSVYGDYIKLLPNDFETNGDGGNTKFGAAFDKTAGQADYGMRTSASNQEMFAFVNIPQGYKATKVEVYGRRAKVVEVFEVQINATTVVSKGTGNCWIPSQTLGDEDITLSGGGVTSTATNLLMIEVVTTAATGDRMYGGRVLIEAI